MTATSAPDALAQAYQADRGRLWSLCYRMTGSAADADDLVQSTFERALARPPADAARPWGGWLFKVALNLSRDHLRERTRRRYKGPWLPEPVETQTLQENLPAASDALRFEPTDTAGRYELLESVSFAFLVALEALSPTQRAVLILRDVLEYSGAAAADALGLSEANVRVVHHRARNAMAGYDAERMVPRSGLDDDEIRSMAERFVRCMAARDVAGLEALLAEDALALNDGAGRYAAAGVPIEGRGQVARFHAGITKGGAFPDALAWTHLNGLPALILEFDAASLPPRRAPRVAVLPRPSADGRIAAVYMVLAPEKLGRVPTVAQLHARTPRA
jgi:RNA polymerase sigma-70 factor (ECF subfamily)